MQLNKIEVQGFKSFAEKTEIVFLDGITTIVGPNGSGKSNISDAVRWVLGEQSVKTLRGSKMEDVIFAGTQARKKVGFAEVSMYLDNSDMKLPVEFKEVVVTRRVYRTGESNYLLNGSECRLKDIQELFMDTGVGRDGYSIISQGKIDEILSTKSEERRHIFEEASGIVKYRTRKDEATRKLDNTQTSLNRVNDILSEIENVIGPLEQKSETAKKFLKLRDELKLLDIKLFLDAISKNDEALNKLDDIVKTFENDILKEEENTEELEKQKIDLKSRINEITLKIEETQNKYFELTNEIEKLNSKTMVATASIENSNTNIERLKNEILEDKEKIEVLNEELIKREDKRKSMTENKLKFENELNLKQNELEDMMKTLDEKGIEIEKIKEKVDILIEERYEIKLQNSSFDTTIEISERQISEKEKELEKSITLKDSISANNEDIKQVLNIKTQKLNEINEQILNLEEENKINFQSLENLDKKRNELKQELMTFNSKLDYLTNLEKENEGYHKSVRSSLEYAKSSNMSGVYGTIASLVTTEEKYEYAIEIAMGGYIQNIVVENDEIAKKLVSYLKENKLGRATFLPLSSIRKLNNDIKSKVQKLDGYIGMAIELVNFDKKYFDAINLSIANTVVVDNIDNAIEISKKIKNSAKIVTLSGELIAATGSITGGQTMQKTAGLLGRREKINELTKKISEKQIIFDLNLKEQNEVNIKYNELKEKILVLKLEQDEIKNDVMACKIEFDSKEKELKKVEIQKEQNKIDAQNLKNEMETLKQKLEENEEKINKINDQISNDESVINDYVRFNREKQQTIDILNEDVVNLKISLSSFDESVASIEELKEKINSDIENFNDGIARKEEQIDKYNSSIEENNLLIESLNEKMSSSDTFKSDYVKITDELKKNKLEMEEKQEEIECNILESSKKQDALKEEKAKVENKKIKFDIELENLKNKMWDDYELTVSSSKKLLEALPESEKENKNIKSEADKIRKQIKDLGEVNVSAIEEYQKTKERYDFINTQKTDLEETKLKLENLISNMTTIMKQQFSKQFKIISENFNETFKELFGGGKAELKLSDESDVLTSGIDIEVEPPGKKLQSMMLLSGGERALTATALLFAILKIKTPPFCILDEIEAALDDVNVHRFAEYIKKYSKATQFIVITHRKGTMEVASSVYGVTMQEYGISKVVSMKLK